MASNDSPSQRRVTLDLGGLLGRLPRLLVLIVMGAAVTALSPQFLTAGNLLNILRQASLIFVLAAGQTVVILAGGIDLSMDSVASLSGVIVANMLEADAPVPIAMAVGLAIGVGLGLFNGVIVTRVRLPPFVTTFGTWLLFKGITMWYNKYRVIHGFPDSFRFFGKGRVGAVPVIILVAGAVLIIFYVLLRYTTFGRKVYATGANPEASRVSGLHINRILIATYAISGLMAAVAIQLYIGRLGSSLSDQGQFFAMDAIWASLLGGVSFVGGIGAIDQVVIGAIVIILLRNALNLLGVPPLWHGFFTGFVVIVAVLGERFLAARGERG